MRANVSIKEELTRYDKIRISEGSDRYNPFSLMGAEAVRSSYIEPEAIWGQKSYSSNLSSKIKK